MVNSERRNNLPNKEERRYDAKIVRSGGHGCCHRFQLGGLWVFSAEDEGRGSAARSAGKKQLSRLNRRTDVVNEEGKGAVAELRSPRFSRTSTSILTGTT